MRTEKQVPLAERDLCPDLLLGKRDVPDAKRFSCDVKYFAPRTYVPISILGSSGSGKSAGEALSIIVRDGGAGAAEVPSLLLGTML
jgi:hypothetical protein